MKLFDFFLGIYLFLNIFLQSNTIKPHWVSPYSYKQKWENS